MRQLRWRHYTSYSHLNPNPSSPSHSAPRSEILRLCESGSLSQALSLLNSADPDRLPPKPILYAALLQACTTSSSFSQGLQLHSRVLKSGLDNDRFVGNSLLSFYFKVSPDFSLTRRVFESLPLKDVISWTSMVSGYIRAGRPTESLLMFGKMQAFGIEPNAFTLSAAIKACSDLKDIKIGSCFHAMVLLRGFDLNHVIASALVDMYGKNFGLEDAWRVFGETIEPDAICWTSIISACTRNDRFEEAVGLFHSMMRRKLGLFPDEFTFGTIMTALGNLGRARQGREAHAKFITSGLGGNVVVESSTVDMYAKCGLMEESRKVFDRMPTKNAVSWCALLGGYCQSGDYETVLAQFREMDTEENHYSFGTILRACAGLSAVRQGKQVHCRFLRTGGWTDVVVESALVDLYAKSGLIDYAYRVFTKISVRNLITWNAMICGFAQNGQGREAIRLFNEMVREWTRPDYISFVGVLFACSHTGLVEEGRSYFKSMGEDYGIAAGIEHYSCMVDLLSRVGLLEEAEDLINMAVYRDDSSLWAALLGACATHSNPDVAERVAKRMMELEPGYHLSYVLLANVYKTVGRWDNALKIRRLMRKRGVRKEPGKSWIEVKRNTSSYIGGTVLVKNESEDLEDLDLDEESANSF
ncbi:pentatricopeptide repeat-containing protein At1g03540 [Phoenix dactylifera]|uniref:Pentatricopeptide repeat-containing protein At1g03540 n=1 Tax=Phoenix dactylifera TaxID=42345 RepID=A0A8B7BFL1_PHODC|nr:pentatricopeptide repeat-containing protein At1g03540 [Phoenix dactylifera]